MSLKTMPSQKTSLFRQFLILVVVGISIVLIQREFSIWLGKRAVDESRMTSLTIESALALAQKDNKPLMVNFSAYWCSYCRAFEKTSLSDEEVQTTIKERFHYVRLEHTEPSDRKWFDRYQVFGFPTVLIVSPAGEFIDQIATYNKPQDFLKQIR